MDVSAIEQVSAPERRRGVQSAEVAVAVLRKLAEAGAPMGLNTLAAQVGLAPAKAHRYLVSLVASGMVIQRKSGAYDLGPLAARIGTAALARVDHINRAGDALPELVERTGLTGMLSVWGAYGATVIRWEKATSQLITALGVGSVLPLTRSATGMAFMAWLPERLLSEAVAREAPELTAVEVASLRARLRMDFVTEASGSFIPGLYALAAPVLNAQRTVEGVITLVATDAGVIRADAPARHALEKAAREIGGCDG